MITLGQLLAHLNAATKVRVFTLDKHECCSGNATNIYTHLWVNNKPLSQRLVSDIQAQSENCIDIFII